MSFEKNLPIVPLDPRFHPVRQKLIAIYASHLDDQLGTLKRETAAMSGEDLSFRPKAGLHSAGMLLAHIAVTELYWMHTADKGLSDEDFEKFCSDILEMDSIDGALPLDEGYLPPNSIRNKDIDHFFGILEKARKETVRILLTWADADLSETLALLDESGQELTMTRQWVLYHVLEHFCSHAGQVYYLKDWTKNPD